MFFMDVDRFDLLQKEDLVTFDVKTFIDFDIFFLIFGRASPLSGTHSVLIRSGVSPAAG